MPGKHNWRQPNRLYNAQKSKALSRNIAWELTFEQWWKIWQDSGKWNKRGKRRGQFVMSRRGDVGPYSVDNIIIKESGENNREGMTGWHEKKQLMKADGAKVRDCSSVKVDATFEKPRIELEVVVEKPAQVIPVEKFRVMKPRIKEVFEKNNFSPNQQKHWTFEKMICLMFPVWGPRWFAPNK